MLFIAFYHQFCSALIKYMLHVDLEQTVPFNSEGPNNPSVSGSAGRREDVKELSDVQFPRCHRLLELLHNN